LIRRSVMLRRIFLCPEQLTAQRQRADIDPIGFAELSTLLAEGLRLCHEPWLEIPA